MVGNYGVIIRWGWGGFFFFWPKYKLINTCLLEGYITHTNTHTDRHTCMHAYIHIYIYVYMYKRDMTHLGVKEVLFDLRIKHT